MQPIPTETGRFGVLLVDKPSGPTSHDIVQTVRRELGERRIGHTGTLDPFASGLLLLCVGPATRLVPYFHDLPKTYEGTIRLGVVTETDDGTGERVAASEAWRALDRASVQGVLATMVGPTAQRPPAYSAKKVGGRRAHREARAGRPLDLPSVEVTIHSLEILEWSPPDIRVRTTVSTGTYIRALARDVGERLGCGAHLADLRRTRIGPFQVKDAADPMASSDEPGGAAWRAGAEAVPWLASRALEPAELERIRHGRPIERGDFDESGGDAGERVALVMAEALIGIGRVDGDTIHPEKVFHGG